MGNLTVAFINVKRGKANLGSAERMPKKVRVPEKDEDMAHEHIGKTVGIYESLIEPYFERLEKNQIVPEEIITKLKILSDSKDFGSTENIIDIIEEYYNDRDKDN